MIGQPTFPLRAAYPFGDEHGLGKEVSDIKEMVIEWDLPYTSSLRRGYIIELFEKRGIFDEFKSKCWSAGDSLEGERRISRYLRIKERYQDFLEGRDTEEEEIAETLEEQQSFAQEADLRDFLAKNPECIEKGLKLHKDGVEFPVQNGRIDILAIDREQRFVVIELKVGRGRNRTVGQLLYYMGWIDQNLSKGKPCRGMIIAKEIPDDLILAVQRVSDVTLFRYNLSVTVEAVSTKG